MVIWWVIWLEGIQERENWSDEKRKMFFCWFFFLEKHALFLRSWNKYALYPIPITFYYLYIINL
jgi:hypothetical protein